MSAGKKFLVANWKMNLLTAQAEELAGKLVNSCGSLRHSEVWLAPAMLSIPAVAKSLKGSSLRLGSQNLHWEASGAFTGEISPPMLSEFGGTFAILGHSERRHVFGETDDLVFRRALGALGSGITPLLCVGETLLQREASQTESVLEGQLSKLKELSSEQLARVVIAYEPVWAIGTGKVAELAQVEHAHKAIKRFMGRSETPVLYGGSVTPENAAGILSLDSVNGCLVGGASLSYEKFCAIIAASEAR